METISPESTSDCRSSKAALNNLRRSYFLKTPHHITASYRLPSQLSTAKSIDHTWVWEIVRHKYSIFRYIISQVYNNLLYYITNRQS